MIVAKIGKMSYIIQLADWFVAEDGGVRKDDMLWNQTSQYYNMLKCYHHPLIILFNHIIIIFNFILMFV